MILADYHLHTSFSSDSESPMEEMIRHAVSLGLKTICFTEHHDIDYPVNPDGFDFLLDLPSYKEEIFKKGNILTIASKSFEIVSYRVHKGYDMVTFKDINNI